MAEEALLPTTIGLIGVGLIGGSLVSGLKEAGWQGQVLGYDLKPGELKQALALGVIDEAVDVDQIARTAELIVLAVPVQAIGTVMREMAPVLQQRNTPFVVTDVASVKCAVQDAVIAAMGDMPPWFVPGHPIAGAERSGVAASRPDLYRGRKVILTPEEQTSPDAIMQVSAVWEKVGAEILTLGVKCHDEVLARTSHLPHMLAFSLVDTLAQQDERLEIFRYAAGGFRDFTRIAASDPIMWRDIFLTNKDALLHAFDEFEQGAKAMRRMIEQGDADAMVTTFSRAQHARQYFQSLLNRSSFQASYHSMEPRNIRFKAAHGGQVVGKIRVPGDKSISHRSIMLGAIAEGTTHVEGFLEGEDSLATLQAFRDMGVTIEGPNSGEVTIHGVGLHGLRKPTSALYLGNSGTGMRLFSGLLAGQAFDTELTGDESLSKRPMNRVADPLRLMGANIETAEGGRPPLNIHGGQSLEGIDYTLPMASAQVKSCLLLAGLYARGETRVTEPAPTRDHTERMLQGFGYPVTREGAVACLKGGGKLVGTNIDVPADISSAAFFLVAASITPGSDLVLEHVGINPTRVGVINILQQMGANIRIENEHEVGGEPVADLHVRYAPLKGIDIPEDQVPLAIDEFPVLFIAAANAEGTTRLRGAAELRVKESDRILAMANGLTALGVENTVHEDGIDIIAGPYGGGEVDSLGDHRIAMAFTVAALRASGDILIDNCANVATSFPNFEALANQVGMHVESETL
ncbi:3-phosphoshikimate 1-carboxyvinyltransferase [Halomonadaceae bacterium LMG 33818]|uniref:bifunctional prephenate dehydrogenase/3-phosphoshikimate 1-carboxyvinyltransferase n=1 Tax=Cernens ardua TaxID=3402176 RepID=UPI003EDC6E32